VYLYLLQSDILCLESNLKKWIKGITVHSPSIDHSQGFTTTIRSLSEPTNNGQVIIVY